jgi:hypothetical protein
MGCKKLMVVVVVVMGFLMIQKKAKAPQPKTPTLPFTPKPIPQKNIKNKKKIVKNRINKN